MARPAGAAVEDRAEHGEGLHVDEVELTIREECEVLGVALGHLPDDGE